jgi:putative ABC transport system permease protein
MAEVRFAARNLARHHTRTIVSLCAIGFGVTALLLTGGFMHWIFWAMREATIYHTGLGHLQVSRTGFQAAGIARPGDYVLLRERLLINRLRRAPFVTVVGERLLVSGLASHGETTVPFTGQAVDPVAERTLSKELTVDGRNLDPSDEDGLLLGRGLARILDVKPGDAVTLLVTIPDGGINAVEGHVRGTFATQVKAYDDRAVRISLAMGRKLLRTEGAHVWVVGLDDTYHTDAVADYLRERLPRESIEVVSWLDLSDFYRKSVGLLSRQIDVVALLIGLIIVLGISNALIMNVLERTGEIGTLLALGTPPRRILWQFVLEGALLGLAGGAVGLAMGFALGAALTHIGIPMPPPPGRDTGYSAGIMVTAPLACGAFALAVAATTLASLYPAWKASRLPIVDALRHNV